MEPKTSFSPDKTHQSIPRAAEPPLERGISPRWRPRVLTYAICLIAVASLCIGLYPTTAAWLSSYNQSRVIENSTESLRSVDPSPDEQLRTAVAYNDALTSGVSLEAGGSIPIGTGVLSNGNTDRLVYRDILASNNQGVMGRLRVEKIGIDLPIYHGTSEETLLKGVGHLEGSHLPVGGEGTRSVLTAHRGLASATMFTNLDQIVAGDRFTLEVMGQVLTYEVRDIQVIDPDDTESLRAVIGRDLVTLITCTPLGINSHRIVVTGERVTPTPIKDIDAAGTLSLLPGFPTWLIYACAGALVIVGFFIRAGFTDARALHNKRIARRRVVVAQPSTNHESTNQTHPSEEVGVLA